MDWTVAHQAPLSMGFSRQEYWRGLLFPPLGDLPDPGVELASLNVSCVGRQVCILVSPGKSVHILRNGNPRQYSCLENPMDKGAWWATVQSIGSQRAGRD